MVAKVKELNYIGPGLRKPDLTLVFYHGQARHGYFDKWFEFCRLEGSSEESIRLLSHDCSYLFDDCLKELFFLVCSVNRKWFEGVTDENKRVLARLLLYVMTRERQMGVFFFMVNLIYGQLSLRVVIGFLMVEVFLFFKEKTKV